MRRRSIAAVLGLCLVSLCLVSAAAGSAPNGIQSKSPDDIVAAALAAGSGARSVWIHGSALDNGSPLAVDLHITKDGGYGHLLAGGLSFDVIRLGPVAYFRGDLAFWRKAGHASASLASLFAGKWMKVSATNKDLGQLVALTQLPVFLHQFLASHGKLTSKGATTFSGIPVVAIEDQREGSLLYVAATGSPYVVALVKKNGNSHGTIRFDGWDRPIVVKAPKHPVDLSKFTK